MKELKYRIIERRPGEFIIEYKKDSWCGIWWHDWNFHFTWSYRGYGGNSLEYAEKSLKEYQTYDNYTPKVHIVQEPPEQPWYPED